jgi:WD40 repeat protein
MDNDQPIHASKVGDKCHSFAWRPNGKQTDGEGVEAARISGDNFILVGWVDQRTGRAEQFRIFDFDFRYSGLGMGKIVLWTPLAEEKTKILISQRSSCVDSLSFSPDGRFLASADRIGKIIIWATEVKQENVTDKL